MSRLGRILLCVLVCTFALGLSPALASGHKGKSSSSSGKSKTVHVKTYKRKNGTVVHAHNRSAPKSKASTPKTPKSKTSSTAKTTSTSHTSTTAKTVTVSSTSTTHPSTYCTGCARDEKGRILRGSVAKTAFERQTGYPHGRPGYVIDHVVPLACGGRDDTSNMQWQSVADAKAKDKWERKGCHD